MHACWAEAASIGNRSMTRYHHNPVGARQLQSINPLAAAASSSSPPRQRGLFISADEGVWGDVYFAFDMPVLQERCWIGGACIGHVSTYQIPAWQTYHFPMVKKVPDDGLHSLGFRVTRARGVCRTPPVCRHRDIGWQHGDTHLCLHPQHAYPRCCT
jgi:hypothetical protein